MILLILSFSYNSYAQEFDRFSIVPNRVDPVFIISSFGFAQTFGPDRYTPDDRFAVGESVDLNLRLSDIVGAYGKVKVGFTVSTGSGHDSGHDNETLPRFSGEGNVRIDTGIAIRLYRERESAVLHQLTLNLKAQEFRAASGGIDTNQIAFDENYYKSFRGQKNPDLNAIFTHAKADLKDNLSRATFGGTETTTLGGFGLSYIFVPVDYFGWQTSLDLLAGNSNEGFVRYHPIESNFHSVLMFNLSPLFPLMLQSGLDETTRWQRYPIVTLSESIHYHDNARLSIGFMFGKIYFVTDQSNMIGNVSTRYSF